VAVSGDVRGDRERANHEPTRRAAPALFPDARPRYGRARRGSRTGGRRPRRRRAPLLALLLLSLGLISALAPVLAPYDPMAVVAPPLLSPSPAHWLGTDHLGRDVLSRLLFGGRWTLGASLLAAAVSALPGVLLGLIGGYFERPAGVLIGRGVDLLLAFPRLLLALGIVALSGSGLVNVALAAGIAGIPVVVRVLRSAVLTQARQVYIEASRALGMGDAGIIRRHIWPNVAGTALVVITLQMGWAILDVSALSFLGLGPPLGTPEWGTMLNEARISLRDAPWAALAPGIALALSVLSINMLGDALRDMMDPHLVQS
jgi:ABC-type dipeptide/oligopeptide/nickel transport system permease subunit